MASSIGWEVCLSQDSHANGTKHRLHRPNRCTIKTWQLFFIDKVLFGPRLSERSFRNLHRAS